DSVRNRHPLFHALHALESAEAHLKLRRKLIAYRWNRAYHQFSLYDKLKYGDSPDFSALDKQLRALEFAQIRLLSEKEAEFIQVKVRYAELVKQALVRVSTAKQNVEQYIHQAKREDALGKELLQTGLFFGAMSIPVSLWGDLSSAGDVYDALRSVHGGF